MAIANIKATIHCSRKELWEVITAYEAYTWRSDLSKTEVVNENQFIEVALNGFATTFTITKVEPYKRWEFDIENDNMRGHWVGLFTANGDETFIDFTEDVRVKKAIMKPFVKIFLRKQQAQFVEDLKKRCEHK